MDVFKLVAFAIVAVVLVLVVKQQRSDIAILLAVSAGAGLLIFSIFKLSSVFDMLQDLVKNSGVSSQFLSIVLKVTAIAYIIEFGKNVCMDAGQSAIANKLEMAGKVIVLTLSIPLKSSLMSLITQLI